MSPLTKWQTNTESHASYTKTDFFSLHQRLAFPCVWASHHAWDRCTSPTPCKTTSMGGQMKMMPQENNGKVVIQWPTSKASLGGLMVSYDFSLDVHQSVHQRWVKTSGKVMWPWTSEGKHTCGGGNDVKAHWHWQIVKPKDEYDDSLNWVMVGKAKQRGSEMGKYPHVRRNDNACLPPWCGMLPHQKRGSLPPIVGWLHTLHSKQRKPKLAKKPELTAGAWGCACQGKRGDSWITPWGITLVTGLNSPQQITPIKHWTAIDSVVNNRRLQWKVLL